MYVIPYMIGSGGFTAHAGRHEITDSIYVTLEHARDSRMAWRRYKRLGADGDFKKGLHSTPI